jgi:hypothetical protein
VVLEGGWVVEVGTIAELKARQGLFANLVTAQLESFPTERYAIWMRLSTSVGAYVPHNLA